MGVDVLSAEVLRKLLNYDPISGRITWAARGPEWFTAESRYSPDRRAAIWNGHYAGKSAVKFASNGYGFICALGKAIMAHRAAWIIATGKVPDEIDHINHVRRDNRLSNLREVSRTENCRNLSRSKANKSGITGIYWSSERSKWVATGKQNGASRNLGRFSCLGEAIKARKVHTADQGFHPNHGLGRMGSEAAEARWQA